MKRRLSREDRELWDRVRRASAPLRPDPLPPPAPPVAPLAAPVRPPAPAPALPPLTPFRIGQAAERRGGHDLLPGLALGAMPLRMDAGRARALRRGKLAPEARLDLHGMTLAEAHGALVSFVLASRAASRRLVLVITGKGKERDDLPPMPARAGRLRHDVPRWLLMPPLRDAVLQVAPAHRRHGGEGALYVYLRRDPEGAARRSGADRRTP